MLNKLRQRFEKFVNNHDPAFVIIISVAVIIWSVALLIVMFSMLFGFWDIIGSDAFSIAILTVCAYCISYISANRLYDDCKSN